jgi:hypothetical protein
MNVWNLEGYNDFKVQKIAPLNAVQVEFGGQKEYYLRIDATDAGIVHWYIPLFGLPIYGFELVADDPKWLALEAAYQAALPKPDDLIDAYENSGEFKLEQPKKGDGEDR